MHELRERALRVAAHRLRAHPAGPVDVTVIANDAGVSVEILEAWFPFAGLLEREIRGYQVDVACQVHRVISTAQLTARQAWQAAVRVLGLKLAADEFFRASTLCQVGLPHSLSLSHLADQLTDDLLRDDQLCLGVCGREVVTILNSRLTATLARLDAYKSWDDADHALQALGEELLEALARAEIAHDFERCPMGTEASQDSSLSDAERADGRRAYC